jgi:uncharacterized tellurite resistance protein B-like protein
MSLFSKFENIFGGGMPRSKASTVLDEKIAAAALMCEVASLDGHFDLVEEQKILKLIEEKLGFEAAEAAELFHTARKMQEDSSQLLYFTRKIKDHYDEKGRLHIMELLWEVVFADGVEDDYESNLMRRLAGLLYVSDKDSGIIRKKVKECQSL